jgi:hypothetical protein
LISASLSIRSIAASKESHPAPGCNSSGKGSFISDPESDIRDPL